jgi:hypothetical protein
MKISMQWNIRPQDALGHFIKAFEDSLKADLYDYLDATADEITQWMQENAVWEDRTGQARDLLRADLVRFSDRTVQIIMHYDPVEERKSGSKHYSLYLETMQAGAYAILGPALDEWGPRIVQDIQEILTSGGSASKPKGGGGNLERDF